MKAKRASLTPNEMRDMLARQAGLCFMPNCMSEGPFIAEHWTPVAMGNDKKPDCLLCEPCADKKTNGLRGDINMIAHTKRIREARTQYDKRKANGGTRIKGAGFKGWRKMNGEVVRNDR